MKKTIIAATFMLSSCGTLMNGSTQDIIIQSEPAGARVIIDQQDYGKTPIQAELPRQKRIVGRVIKDGYIDDGFVMNSSPSKWSTWGNFAFVSLATPVFMAFDVLTGSFWSYKKDSVFVKLEKQ